jgi:hypothetical protein
MMGSVEELVELLSRIVVSPAQIESLYAVLGPFYHQGRNILNSIKLSLYLARREQAQSEIEEWSEVEKSYQEIEDLYDSLQLIFRPISLSRVRMSLTLLMEDRRKSWVDRFAVRGGTLELVGPRMAAVGEYDPNCLGRALDGFVRWRAGVGENGSSALLNWSTKGGDFHVEWTELEPVFKAEEGVNARGAIEASRHEPLALPILGRVVTAHGGAMELIRPLGQHLRLSWPQVVCRPR